MMDGKGHAAVQAINGAAGGVHQVPDIVMAAALEHVHKADDIAVYVGVGVLR